ncbi:MAG: RadC family protein [Alphaproteobacteria bacterium]|nr:RadC family protein [Alphaproteobacteria bacterium]
MLKESVDSSLTAGHRERLRQKFLDGKLAKYEVLELLLSYAIPRRDVRPLSRRLYQKFGGMFPILSASIEKLCEVPGMGRNTAIFIKTVQQIILDGYRDELQQQPIFHNMAQFENYCKLEIGGKNVEEMHIIHLDSDGRLLEDQLHCVGTLDETPLYAREVIKHAFEIGTKNIALLHNHPCKNVSFSTQDVDITKVFISQLNTVGIGFVDHYLVSGGILYSMKNLHILDYSAFGASGS